MKTRWMGAALAVCCLTLTATVRAQVPPPNQNVPLMPEPAPCSDAYPGPLDPLSAPQGPSGDLGLPPYIHHAFEDPHQVPTEPHGVYLHVGTEALMRQRLGHQPVTLLDNTNRGIDTGNVPRFDSHVILDTNDVKPQYQWGVRATLGYMNKDNAVELTGFYLPETSFIKTRARPGRLSSYFFNAPLGFEGDNGIFLQDDITRATLRSQIGSGELNYRWWNKAQWGLEGILGLRYFDSQETLSYFFDDDGIVRPDIRGRPDPLRQATYLDRSHSRLVGPQVGCEWNYPVTCWFTIGANVKGAWGANFVEIDKRLTRGDGLIGFNGKNTDTIFSHLYEIGLYGDISLWEQVRVRFGYNALWLVHVPDAQTQLQFDLANQFPGRNDNGSIFYHGPMVELQLFF
jgi:hypothetical protein